MAVSEEKKKDLTRIEDLSGLDHENDSDVDRKLKESHTGLEEDPEVPSPSALETQFEPQKEEEEEEEFQENFQEDFQENSGLLKDEELEQEQEVEAKEEEEEFQENFQEDFQENSDLLKDEELEQEQEVEAPAPQPQQDKFEEVREFAKSLTYGKVEKGGNPPFSLILRNIKYREDVEDIKIILGEHNLLSSEMEQSLPRGSILISQISEYAAIYLAHKFRRFDLDIQVGLSDELHPTQSYENDARGLIGRENQSMEQNKTEQRNLKEGVGASGDTDSVILTTTPIIEGHKILRYIDVITKEGIMTEEEFASIKDDPQNPFYGKLTEKLRLAAIKRKGNAVVGIHYQFTPLVGDQNQGGHNPVRYKITCTGSVVFASPREQQ